MNINKLQLHFESIVVNHDPMAPEVQNQLVEFILKIYNDFSNIKFKQNIFNFLNKQYIDYQCFATNRARFALHHLYMHSLNMGVQNLELGKSIFTLSQSQDMEETYNNYMDDFLLNLAQSLDDTHRLALVKEVYDCLQADLINV